MLEHIVYEFGHSVGDVIEGTGYGWIIAVGQRGEKAGGGGLGEAIHLAHRAGAYGCKWHEAAGGVAATEAFRQRDPATGEKIHALKIGESGAGLGVMQVNVALLLPQGVDAGEECGESAWLVKAEVLQVQDTRISCRGLHEPAKRREQQRYAVVVNYRRKTERVGGHFGELIQASSQV